MVRKAPKLNEAAIRKLIGNPRTPAQLKAFWKNKLKELLKKKRRK